MTRLNGVILGWLVIIAYPIDTLDNTINVGQPISG